MAAASILIRILGRKIKKFGTFFVKNVFCGILGRRGVGGLLPHLSLLLATLMATKHSLWLKAKSNTVLTPRPRLTIITDNNKCSFYQVENLNLWVEMSIECCGVKK